MGRKNSPSANKELNELIAQYETAKAENRQLYLDGDQLADIADRYAAERKFDEAQEVITYGLHLHPDSTDLLVEQYVRESPLSNVFYGSSHHIP